MSNLFDSGLSVFDSGEFTQMHRIAEVLADASLLPEHLRGCWKVKASRQNNWKGEWEDYPREVRVANAMLVVNAARLWKCDPFQLASHSYVVGGKLDFDGQVYAAMVNHHGGLAEPMSVVYEGEGTTRAATISGRLSHEAEARKIDITWLGAHTKDREGKPTSQWTNDCDQMLFYAGCRKWVRRHCPQVMLGLVSITPDETERPLKTIDHKPAESQRMLEQQLPPEDYTKLIERLEQVQRQDQLEKIVLDAKFVVNKIGEERRDEIIDKARKIWPRLQSPDEEPEESFRRWERTIKGETRMESLTEHREAVAKDTTLTDGGRQELLELIDEFISEAVG